MPPPKTIFVDTDRMLRSIAEQAEEQRAAALIRTADFGAPQRQEALRLAAWVPRNLVSLAGRKLTPSERKRHQEAIRRMEIDGLVCLGARHVRITDAGRARLAERVEEAAEQQ